MPRLPRVSGREAVAVFQRVGFAVRDQRGSHIVMTKPGVPSPSRFRITVSSRSGRYAR